MTGVKNDKRIPSVLIVDDVEANRFILRDIIMEMGYQPILAENGEQAMKIVQRIRPNLIILDIAMPVMDGFEFCKWIKAKPDMQEVPVIFISAMDETDDILECFSLGANDYIKKPFLKEVVKARVGVQMKLHEATTSAQEATRQLQLSNREQLKQMEAERRSVLYVLLRVARENACYNEAYMERLRRNCRILAEAMQLSEFFGYLIPDSYVDMLELAAPLCDLGNMTIPINILQKQGALDAEENIIMQTHTTMGARILKDIRECSNDNSFLKMAEEIAHYHHENWDGSGYPEGKCGNEIPLAAQIVSVVNSYCALTEKRTYREAFDRVSAFEIMEQEMEKRFNPEIFRIMKKIARQLQ